MKTRPNKSIERLLTIWHDRALFINLEAKFNNTSNTPLPYESFEQHLADVAAQRKALDTTDTFWTQSWKDTTSNERRFTGGISFALERWAASSRRIFQIEDDLQLLLDATSLEGIRLHDVGFPFDAFAVETDEPFIGAGGQPIDTFIFVVERSNENCIIHIFAIKKRTESYLPIPITLKNDAIKAIKNGNTRKAESLLRKIEKHTANIPIETLHSRLWPLDTEIDVAIEEMRADLNSETAQLLMASDVHSTDVIDTFGALLRMVFGMCLYLKSLPADAPQVSPWQTLPKQATDRTRVTNDASVCRVESTFKLKPHERDVFGPSAQNTSRSFGEKCCHFRRGTWCRPKGSAPDAQRTEWRRPTIVRPDRLAPGEIPKGARSILLST